MVGAVAPECLIPCAIADVVTSSGVPDAAAATCEARTLD